MPHKVLIQTFSFTNLPRRLGRSC